MTENGGEWECVCRVMNELARMKAAIYCLRSVGWLVRIPCALCFFSFKCSILGNDYLRWCVSECFKQVKTTLNYCHRLTFLLSLSSSLIHSAHSPCDSMNHINCYTFVVFLCVWVCGYFLDKISCFVVHCCAFRFYFALFSIFQSVWVWKSIFASHFALILSTVNLIFTSSSTHTQTHKERHAHSIPKWILLLPAAFRSYITG